MEFFAYAMTATLSFVTYAGSIRLRSYRRRVAGMSLAMMGVLTGVFAVTLAAAYQPRPMIAVTAALLLTGCNVAIGAYAHLYGSREFPVRVALSDLT